MSARPNTPETFWARTEQQGECLVWTGATDPKGYGKVSWESRDVKAHRLAFFLRTGRWPDTDLRHLCDNPPCVLHVVEGSQRDNIHDAIRAGTHASVKEAAKTHCPAGHAYDDINTYWAPGTNSRHCRACHHRHRCQRRAAQRFAETTP